MVDGCIGAHAVQSVHHAVGNGPVAAFHRFLAGHEFGIDQSVGIHGCQRGDDFLRFIGNIAVHHFAVPQHPVGIAAGEAGAQAIGAKQRLHRGNGASKGVVIAVTVRIFLGKTSHQGNKIVHGLWQRVFRHAQLVQPVAAVDQRLVGHGSVGFEGRNDDHLAVPHGCLLPGFHRVSQIAVGGAAHDKVVDVRSVLLEELFVPALDDALVNIAVQGRGALGQEYVRSGFTGQLGVQDLGIVALLNIDHFNVHIDAVLVLQHLFHSRGDNILVIVDRSEHVACHRDLDRFIFSHGGRHKRNNHHQCERKC